MTTSNEASAADWGVELDQRIAVDALRQPAESASDLLTECSPSVRSSTAPYFGMPTAKWLALRAALQAEGCSITSVNEDRGVWHGHSVGALVWTITGRGREFTATESANCCTGKPHLVALPGMGAEDELRCHVARQPARSTRRHPRRA